MVTVRVLLVCPTLFEDPVVMLDAPDVCPLLKVLDDVCPTVVVLYTVVSEWEDVWLDPVVLCPVELKT